MVGQPPHITAHEALRRAAVSVVGAAVVAAGAIGARPADASPAESAPRGAGAQVHASTASATAASRAPWRWRTYLAQKPAWKTSTCSPAAVRLSGAVRELNPGSRVECARIMTPLDWRDLRKGSAPVQLTRVTRTVVKGDKRATRTLFVNPGGPGVTADWMPATVATLEPAVARTHQIVALDVRGTGRSAPVSCRTVDDKVRDHRSTTTASISAQQRAVRATVQACAKANPKALPQISTQNVVRDHDLVRQLLAAKTVDYYGVSAGTWLGARYAEAFPAHVGRFVLDSNTEFSTDWRASFAWQPMGFQRRFDAQFVPWAARHHADYGLGTTAAKVRATYTALRAAVVAGRVRGLTPAMFDDRVSDSLYGDEDFLDLASALAELNAARVTSGRSVAAVPQEWRTPQSDSEDAEDTVFMATQCNDSVWSKAQSSYAAQGVQLGRRYPLIGYMWVTSPCAYWPYAPQVAKKPASTTRPTMLMVQTELDPATPLEGARRAHVATRGTRMITVDNQGNHGAYLGENPCVEKTVTAYLTSGTLPARDVTCAGLPLPGDAKVYPVGPLSAATSTARPKASTRTQEDVRDTAADKIAANTPTSRG